MQQLAAIDAAQPAPQRRRRGWHLDPGAAVHWKIAQARNLASQRKHGRPADADHRLCCVDGVGELRQRSVHVRRRRDFERQVAGQARHRGEDAGPVAGGSR